jgi:hypothetical protein
MDAQAVVSEGPICMLPFVPLMNGGADCFDQAEAIIYGSERERPVKADMLTSMAIFSGLISVEIPAQLIARRKDIMMESVAYDIIKQEGIKEGIQKGINEGIEKGIKKGIKKGKKETARNLLLLGVLTEEQIAQATGIPIEEVRRLKEDIERVGLESHEITPQRPFFSIGYLRKFRTAYCKEKGYYDGIRSVRYYKTRRYQRRHSKKQKGDSQKSAVAGRSD